MIRRLAYVSRPRPDLPAAEISRIVVRWRINNEREAGRVVFVDSLPHTASGKLSKLELRRPFAN